MYDATEIYVCILKESAYRDTKPLWVNELLLRNFWMVIRLLAPRKSWKLTIMEAKLISETYNLETHETPENPDLQAAFQN